MQHRKHIITYHTRKPGQFVSVHTLKGEKLLCRITKCLTQKACEECDLYVKNPLTRIKYCDLSISDVFMCNYEMGLNNCLKIIRKCQTKKE